MFTLVAIFVTSSIAALAMITFRWFELKHGHVDAHAFLSHKSELFRDSITLVKTHVTRENITIVGKHIAYILRIVSQRILLLWRQSKIKEGVIFLYTFIKKEESVIMQKEKKVSAYLRDIVAHKERFRNQNKDN